MKKNPFKILGLDSDLLRNLREDQIQQLVKSQYRFLQGIFHPDKRRGKGKESREINWAYEQLENHLLFKDYLRKFLHRRTHQKKYQEVMVEMERVTKRWEKWFELLEFYLFCACGLDYSRDRTASALEKDQTTVFALLDGYNLTVIDTLSYPPGINLTDPEERDQRKNRHSFEISFSRSGKVVKRKKDNGQEVMVSGRKWPIGCMESGPVSKYNGIYGLLAMIAELQGKYHQALRIGSGDKVIIDYRQGDPRLGRRMSVEWFRPLLELLTPRVRNGSHLFTLNERDGLVFFALEGIVIDIKPIV